jgi:metal-sulfur cluster biosynthetic enzyme
MRQGETSLDTALARLESGPPPSGPTEAGVRAALRSVIDPEVGLDVVTLGLIYGVEVEGGAVTVTFSLTVPGCPLVDYIAGAIRMAALGVPGVEAVDLNLVWEPAWHPGMIEEGAW